MAECWRHTEQVSGEAATDGASPVVLEASPNSCRVASLCPAPPTTAHTFPSPSRPKPRQKSVPRHWPRRNKPKPRSRPQLRSVHNSSNARKCWPKQKQSYHPHNPLRQHSYNIFMSRYFGNFKRRQLIRVLLCSVDSCDERHTHLQCRVGPPRKQELHSRETAAVGRQMERGVPLRPSAQSQD